MSLQVLAFSERNCSSVEGRVTNLSVLEYFGFFQGCGRKIKAQSIKPKAIAMYSIHSRVLSLPLEESAG